MKKSSLILTMLFQALILTTHADSVLAQQAAVFNTPTVADGIKINELLDNYTDSVSKGDRVRFESQLLDLNIPFAAVDANNDAKKIDLASIQDYAGFRRGIFDSGEKFHQRFSNVKIEQLGNLAQVSLDYETELQGTEYSSKGWKVVQLIKINGQWKIVSEFFTGYPAKS